MKKTYIEPIITETIVVTNEIIATALVPHFVSTFKRFCNQEYGENIWQSRYYDHIIRNQRDYDEIWEYIDNNPRKWMLERK